MTGGDEGIKKMELEIIGSKRERKHNRMNESKS